SPPGRVLAVEGKENALPACARALRLFHPQLGVRRQLRRTTAFGEAQETDRAVRVAGGDIAAVGAESEGEPTVDGCRREAESLLPGRGGAGLRQHEAARGLGS